VLCRQERLFASHIRHAEYRRGATVLTSEAERYRAKARECEERAEQTRDSFIKEQLLEIAKAWRNIAAYEEKHSR
jgi:hypothetical protein